MVYALREGAQAIRTVEDQHVLGLFAHNEWIGLISNAGFEAKSIPFEHSDLEPGSTFVFVGIKS